MNNKANENIYTYCRLLTLAYVMPIELKSVNATLTLGLQ